MWCTDASRTRRHFKRTRQADSMKGWCRRSWNAWRAAWICRCWIGRADERAKGTSETDWRRGLAILADAFLMLLPKIGKHALVALSLFLRHEAESHAIPHVGADVDA